MGNGIYLLLIFISSAVSIYSKYKLQKIYSYVKAIPLILLIIFLISKSDFYNEVEYFVFLGLILSLLGDIALLFKKHFYLGLIFFLLAHLLYFLGFYIYAVKINFILLIPFLIYSFIFFFTLNLRDIKQKFAVVLYILAISLMGFSALNLFISEFGVATLLLFCGSILFIFSDSILSLNKFKKKFKIAELLILSSYYLAQTLITIGIILFFNNY